jgi:hypothetical protein
MVLMNFRLSFTSLNLSAQMRECWRKILVHYNRERTCGCERGELAKALAFKR